MNIHITWANETVLQARERVEHVSFVSFVKHFKIEAKARAITQYEDLLESERIKLKRRELLKTSYTEFVGTRMESFWSMWEAKTELAHTQNKLKLTAANITKKNAIMAQEASVLESEKTFNSLCSTKHQGAQHHFDEVTALIPMPNQQLEGGNRCEYYFDRVDL